MSSPDSVSFAARAAVLPAAHARGRAFAKLHPDSADADAEALLPPRAPRNTCLPLDMSVPSGGYAWWYFDAESDCGQYSLCVIAFVGSVFSPYYARAQRRGEAAADDHIALNVALYGKKKAWVFTEAEGFGPSRTRYELRLRKSALKRVDDGYTIDIDERQVPGYQLLRGRIHIRFTASGGLPRPLDAAGEHHWWPVAPISRVQVALDAPKLTWSGRAYHDVNWGLRPLTQAFRQWSWLRALHPEGTLVYYAAQGIDGHAARAPFGTLYRHDGSRQDVALPAAQTLQRSRWGLRPICYGTQDVAEHLEDTPFYTRAKVRLPFASRSLSAFHEYLDVERLQSGWVRHLLRFRMRRHKGQSAPRAFLL